MTIIPIPSGSTRSLFHLMRRVPFWWQHITCACVQDDLVLRMQTHQAFIARPLHGVCTRRCFIAPRPPARICDSINFKIRLPCCKYQNVGGCSRRARAEVQIRLWWDPRDAPRVCTLFVRRRVIILTAALGAEALHHIYQPASRLHWLGRTVPPHLLGNEF